MLVVAVLCAYLIGSIPFALLLARKWGVRRSASHRQRKHRCRQRVARVRGTSWRGRCHPRRRQGRSRRAGGGSSGGCAVRGGACRLRRGGRSHLPGLASFPRRARGWQPRAVCSACCCRWRCLPRLSAFAATIWATRYISAGSVIAIARACRTVAYATGAPASVVAAACASAALIVFRHRSNLMRVRGGTERRVGARA